MAGNRMEMERQYPLRPFFVMWSGQAVSLLGSQLVQFALIWYLTEKTGSATVLALASLVGLLPGVVLGPIAGTLVDRWNRRWVMMGADSLVAAATALLLVLFASGQVQVWQILAILFVRSLGGTFHGPAMMASTSLMVPPRMLTRIAGINQMLQGGLNIVSAPLGALLVVWLPMQGILAIDIVSFLAAMIPLFFIHVPQPEASARPTGAGVAAIARDLKEGLRYVWNWSGLRGLVLITVSVNFLLAPAFSLMPILITTHFGGGALQLGWMNATFGVGVLLGGLLLSAWGGFQRKMLTALLGLALLGVSTLALGLTPADRLTLGIAAMFGVGSMVAMVNGPIIAIMQTVVAPEKQGRVFTLLGSLSAGMTPLGLLIAGPVADAIGVRVWYLAGGVLCLALGLLGATNSAVMHLDQAQVEPNEAESAPVVEAAAVEATLI